MLRNGADGERLRTLLNDPRRELARLGLLGHAVRDGDGFKLHCLWHAERTPSLRVARGRAGTIRVHCFGCGFTGDILSLIAAARGLDIRRDYSRVLAEAATLAGVDLCERSSPPPPIQRAPLPERPPIPPAELAALWRASTRLDQTDDPAVLAFLAQRRYTARTLTRLDAPRVLPAEQSYAWPSWWPARWAAVWRLAILSYDPATGTPVSLHARAVIDAGPDAPKDRWPWRTRASYDTCRGLFADPAGRRILAGGLPYGIIGVIITEGLTDTLAVSQTVAERSLPYAVLGGASGTFRSFANVRWPGRIPGGIYTDQDAAGDRYADEICRALPQARLYRWRPGVNRERCVRPSWY